MGGLGWDGAGGGLGWGCKTPSRRGRSFCNGRQLSLAQEADPTAYKKKDAVLGGMCVKRKQFGVNSLVSVLSTSTAGSFRGGRVVIWRGEAPTTI